MAIDGSKLRAYRRKRTISQGEVATELGISKQAVSGTESGTAVGVDVAERYLNAIERVIATAEDRDPVILRIRMQVVVDAPYDVKVDYAELQGIVS